MGLTRYGRLPNPIAFPGYILGPNGGRVFYCDSGGVRDGTQDDIANLLYTSLNQAMSACRANRGDTICVLPGHTESVTATTPTFVAGVRIVGVGNGDERPTFNWTVAGSIWTVAVANVSIENCILNLSNTAATVTTKAISVSGARFSMKDCQVNMGASSTQHVTIGIELVTGADRAIFDGNDVLSSTDSAVVNVFKLTNAVDQLRITNNVISVGMSTTAGSLVTMTTAPTNVIIKNNELTNSITSSTKALVGVTAATGQVAYNDLYITAATGGATAIGTLGSIGFCQNFGCATNGSGLLTPAAGS